MKVINKIAPGKEMELRTTINAGLIEKLLI